MNPKTYHTKLAQFNGVSKYVRSRRINKEAFRMRMAKAKFIPAPLLVRNDGTRKAAILRKAA